MSIRKAKKACTEAQRLITEAKSLQRGASPDMSKPIHEDITRCLTGAKNSLRQAQRELREAFKELQ